jgi:hypothetical protein
MSALAARAALKAKAARTGTRGRPVGRRARARRAPAAGRTVAVMRSPGNQAQRCARRGPHGSGEPDAASATVTKRPPRSPLRTGNGSSNGTSSAGSAAVHTRPTRRGLVDVRDRIGPAASRTYAGIGLPASRRVSGSVGGAAQCRNAAPSSRPNDMGSPSGTGLVEASGADPRPRRRVRIGGVDAAPVGLSVAIPVQNLDGRLDRTIAQDPGGEAGHVGRSRACGGGRRPRHRDTRRWSPVDGLRARAVSGRPAKDGPIERLRALAVGGV